MKKYIDIVYNSSHGGFVVPRALYTYLCINEDEYEKSNVARWNVRKNKKLVHLIKLMNKYGFTEVMVFLKKDCGITSVAKIFHFLQSLAIISVPEEAYNGGAISYTEYDGGETIELDNQKMLILKTKKSLQTLANSLNKEISKNKSRHIQKIINTLPDSFELPNLEW